MTDRASAPGRASGEPPDRVAPCDSDDPIEHFWTEVARGWDIEPRAYFEKEAVPMGFRSPVEMAVHWMWKRRVHEDHPAVALSSPSTQEPEITCPACNVVVKQVASATLSLALWQHWNWTCSHRVALSSPSVADSPTPEAKCIELIVCARCGQEIQDGGLCGYTCALDGKFRDERESSDVISERYVLVSTRKWSAPSPSAAAQQETP